MLPWLLGTLIATDDRTSLAAACTILHQRACCGDRTMWPVKYVGDLVRNRHAKVLLERKMSALLLRFSAWQPLHEAVLQDSLLC